MVLNKITRSKESLTLFLFALPIVLYVFLFSYVPIFGWFIAFTDYKPGLPLFGQKFIGLMNFKFIFSGATDLGNVLVNTLALSFLGLLFTPVPAIFAILLTFTRSAFSRVVQTMTSLPYFVSWVLVYSIVFAFFSSMDGVANKFLMDLGIISQPLNVLNNEGNAWFIQVILFQIKNTGWAAIIYIAALTGIDPELYNAAEVDGANRFQKIFHITVPGILPTYFVLLLFAIAGILSNGFEQYFVFQNPVNVSKLEVLDTYMYRLGILQGRFSYSTAVGVFKSVVSILLLFIANGASKRIRGSSMF